MHQSALSISHPTLTNITQSSLFDAKPFSHDGKSHFSIVSAIRIDIIACNGDLRIIGSIAKVLVSLVEHMSVLERH